MSDLTVEVSDHIATVTIDRPPVNAVTGYTYMELRDVFRSFDDEQDVRVAVLTAAGSRAFVAGVDLRVGPRVEDPPPTLVTDHGRLTRQAMWAITDCAVPVIAAVNGPALGAGLALAACCDVIFAAEGATFATPEINLGLLGASAHLSRLVGRYMARDLFFTGRAVPAEELHRVGAVHSVVPFDDLAATVREYAATLAAKSPIALRLAKESMNRIESVPLKEAYRTEQDYTDRLNRFEDAKEARAAYRERRDPDWKWR